MAGFNGKWKLVSSENAEAYFAAVKAPEEFKAQLRALAVEHKANPGIYLEEIKLDKAAGTIQRLVYIKGEVKRDSGLHKFGNEHEGAVHGKTGKLTAVLESDTKIVRKEVGADFNSTTILELNGDELTATLTSGDVVAKEKYVRV